MTGMSAGDFTFVVNNVLLVLGFIFLGTNVGIKTVYASMLMSFSLSALERICPLSGPLTKEPLLELIFAIMAPVSYTHLDVYKRQEQCRASIGVTGVNPDMPAGLQQ